MSKSARLALSAAVLLLTLVVGAQTAPIGAAPVTESAEEGAFATYSGIARSFPAFGDLLGKGIAADLSGDTIPDLLLGSTLVLGTSLYVIFGPITDGPHEVFPAAFYRFVGSGDFGGFTASHPTAGDLNGDGRADLVFGDADYQANAGRIVIRFGPLPVGDETEESITTGSPWLTITGVEPLQRVGWQETAVIDFNRDGRNDLLIRAPRTGDGGAHAIHVFFGPLRPGTHAITSANMVLLGTGIGQAPNLKAGDANADGVPDLYLNDAAGDGAIYLGPFQNGQELQDPAVVGNGIGGFFPIDFDADGRLDLGTQRGILFGPPFGRSISPASLDLRYTFESGEGVVTGLGDITADGIDDFLVADPTANNNAGQAAVIAGGRSAPQSITLRTGWNLVSWTGLTTTPTAATAGIAGTFTGLFLYDAESGGFSSYQPAAPAAINTAGVIRDGEALWIFSTVATPLTWEQPGLRHGRIIALRPGFNLVSWTGPDDTPLLLAIAAIQDALDLVVVWDAARQTYVSLNLTLPEHLLPEIDLDAGQGLWVRAQTAVEWAQPPNR